MVKRKVKTSKRKSIKKKAKESKRKNPTTQKGKKNSRKNKEKIKQHRRKQKRRNQKAQKAHSRQSASCSGDISKVDSKCLEDAMRVLVFEANQVMNYLKQSKILLRHKNQ